MNYENTTVHTEGIALKALVTHVPDQGYYAEAPGFPGMVVQAGTRDDALHELVVSFKVKMEHDQRQVRPAFADTSGELMAIAAWCERTFGPITPLRLVERAHEEMQELHREVTKTNAWTAAARDEVADVFIVLSRVPGLWEAIQRKYEIVQQRKFEMRGDGTGYTVGGSGGVAGDPPGQCCKSSDASTPQSQSDLRSTATPLLSQSSGLSAHVPNANDTVERLVGLSARAMSAGCDDLAEAMLELARKLNNGNPVVPGIAGSENTR